MEKAVVRLPQEQPLGRWLIRAALWAQSWDPASEGGLHLHPGLSAEAALGATHPPPGQGGREP